MARFSLSTVSDDQLLVALIGALTAGVIAFGIAVWQFKAESRRSRAAVREQALLDSTSDLATRLWTTMRAVEALKERAPTWPVVQSAMEDLRVGLLGYAPRYRIAGVSVVSDRVTSLMESFISRWAAVDGQVRALRGTHEMVVEEREAEGDTHADALLYAKSAFARTQDDIEDALRLTHDSMFEALRDYIRGTLVELSKYVPGEPMTLSEPTGSWIGFERVLEGVVAARMDRGRSGLADGDSRVNG